MDGIKRWAFSLEGPADDGSQPNSQDMGDYGLLGDLDWGSSGTTAVGRQDSLGVSARGPEHGFESQTA